MTPELTRRRFIQSSVAAIAAPSVTAAASSAPATTSAPASQPRRLNIGIVGCAHRGFDHVREVHAIKNANVVALCDVDVNYLVAAARHVTSARPFVDFRDMLKMPDLDAVVVATPDHTHGVITAAALRAGKHAYCEKPLCHTVAETRAITRLAAETKRVTQMGIQIHAMDNYRRVVELIRAGAIGPVSEVHAWHGRGHRGLDVKVIEAPATFDYDLWLGPAAHRPLEADFHPFNWRRRWAFGSGMLGDIGCHLMDVAFWALDLKHPTRVTCAGGGASESVCPEWNVATYEFAEREGAGGAQRPAVKLTWYDAPKFPPMRDQWKLPEKFTNEGVVFVGARGLLYTNYGEHALLPAEQFADFKRPAATIPSSPGHQAEWINACLANDPAATSTPFAYGGPLTETALLGLAAFRAAPGKALEWDAANMRFTDLPAADAFLAPDCRAGWTI